MTSIQYDNFTFCFSVDELGGVNGYIYKGRLEYEENIEFKVESDTERISSVLNFNKHTINKEHENNKEQTFQIYQDLYNKTLFDISSFEVNNTVSPSNINNSGIIEPCRKNTSKAIMYEKLITQNKDNNNYNNKMDEELLDSDFDENIIEEIEEDDDTGKDGLIAHGHATIQGKKEKMFEFVNLRGVLEDVIIDKSVEKDNEISITANNANNLKFILQENLANIEDENLLDIIKNFK